MASSETHHDGQCGPVDSRQYLGTHRLIRTLGSGGMGVVYVAEDTQTRREVALKVVAQLPLPFLPIKESSPEGRSPRRDRFATEVQTTARLDHPNIVTVYTAERTSEYAYYTMKLVHGVDLRRLIELMIERRPRNQRIGWQLDEVEELLRTADIRPRHNNDTTRSIRDSSPVSESSEEPIDDVASTVVSRIDRPRPNKGPTRRTSAETSQCEPVFSEATFTFFARRMAEAADAIAHAHEQGVLHRDIKPSNLIADRAGKVYVTDFGLAKWMQGNEDESTACVGTRGYIAPECLESSSAFDPRSEVFSFGCVLHKLMTLRPARPPAPGDQSWTATAQNLLPQGLYAIVRKAMSSNPSERYDDVAELAADLHRFADGNTVEAVKALRQSTSTTQRTLSQKMFGGKSLMSLAVVSLLLLCLLLGGQLYRQSLLNKRADTLLEISLEALQESYHAAGGEMLPRGPREPARSRLSDETKQSLNHSAEMCRSLLAERKHVEPRLGIKIAALLRTIAVIFDGAGETAQAAAHYGWAASVLEQQSDSDPFVVGERAWLHYLETRRLERMDGYASQSEKYRRLRSQVEESITRKDLDAAQRSRLHEIAGLVAIAQRDYRRAVRHLLQVGDKAEFGEYSLTMSILTAYRMGGQFEKALPLAERLTEENERNDEAWRNLAGLKLSLDQVAEAKSAFQRCVDLNPSNALGWQGLAWAYFRSGQNEKALEFIENACQLAPQNDTILTARAKFRMRAGEIANAASDFRQALRLRPSSLYVAYPAIVTLTFWEGGDDEDRLLARRTCQKHSRQWPTEKAHELDALVKFRGGDYRGAALAGQKADPQNPCCKLVVLAAEICAAEDEIHRQHFADQLADWRANGWSGLDDGSTLTRLIQAYVTSVLLEESHQRSLSSLGT